MASTKAVPGCCRPLVFRRVALLTLLLLLLGSAGAAFAHAQLVASDPADGAVLAAAPDEIVLTFSEPVDPLVFRLSDPTGQVEILPATGSRSGAASGTTRLVVKLPIGLAVGTHSLSWRVTSADGHPIGGGLLFSIGIASARAPNGASVANPVTSAGLWASRLLAMTGLIIGVGGAGWAALLFRQRHLRGHAGLRASEKGLDRTMGGFPLVALSLCIGIAATPVWIAFQGLDALGEAATGLASAEVWSAGLAATAYGRAAVVGAAAMVLALVSLRVRHLRFRSGLAGVAFVLAGLATAMAGHAATAPPRFATAPAITLHMLAAMTWIGGLLPLWEALCASKQPSAARDPDMAALLLFSRLIPFVLAVLVASGLLLSIVQVQTLSNLMATAYGWVLLAKLAIVALLILLAAANRFFWTRPAAGGSPDELRRLRRSILAEVVLGTLVLAVLGLWRFTPPPRALAVSGPSVHERQVEEQGLMAALSITPARTGPVRISLQELMFNGQPVDPLSVTVALDNPANGIGPFTRVARRGEDGAFQAEGLVLPVAGAWTVRVTVLVDDFTSVTMTSRFDIAAP
ncbi:copper resistance CopC/CopD family protein [Rhizobium sp. 9140]|uniref:copper resistance CopC/CopD family protein n=1 Tax=Rhizobium sp. 9140 TaxID=1761900 RepID=UPI00079BA640|nr:copper resistance protein CopC [Rhizobium sp. 9140]CZT36088.1 copper transport protein [Rhizobium sp. 9140]